MYRVGLEVRALNLSGVNNRQGSLSLTSDTGDKRQPQDGPIHKYLALNCISTQFSEDMHNKDSVTS